MTPLIECDARLRFKIIRFKTRTKPDLKVRRRRGEDAAIATLDVIKGARAWIDTVKHGVVVVLSTMMERNVILLLILDTN